MTDSLAIIGTGMAGARLAESLVAEGYRGAITMIGEERVNPYNRIQLSSVLAGDKTLDGLPLLSEDWYRANRIQLHCGDPVVALDAAEREVVTASGWRQQFDRIVIATGSRPYIPAIHGNNLPGVMAFRTLDDIAIMQSFAEQGERALVVGGGLLGLEAAYGLNQLGLDVTVVHNSDTLMNRQLDRRAARLLQQSLEGRGIRILTGVRSAAVTGTERAGGLQLEDGRWLAGELIVFATGITPNVEVFDGSGLEINRGIVVDDQMRTSAAGIYALGECAEHNGITVGIVAPIWDQASVLTETLLGRPARYHPREHSTQLKVSGIDVFSAGNLKTDQHSRDILVSDPLAGVYRRLVIRDNRLQAALLFGDKSQCSQYEALIGSGQLLGAHENQLMFGAALS
ncbi:NAD(P)/FAD-dependent oxidoreductase [Porticoccus sp.]